MSESQPCLGEAQSPAIDPSFIHPLIYKTFGRGWVCSRHSPLGLFVHSAIFEFLLEYTSRCMESRAEWVSWKWASW